MNQDNGMDSAAAVLGDAEAPDLIEPVLAFKLFSLTASGHLWPHFVWDGPWLPGINVARCLRETSRGLDVEPEPVVPEPSPHAGCNCGLNAVWHVSSLGLRRHPGAVVGALATFGRMDLYGRGVRAEKAVITAIARRPGRGKEDWYQRAGDRYGVEVVELKDLVGAGLRHASPLPAGFLHFVEEALDDDLYDDEPPSHWSHATAPPPRDSEGDCVAWRLRGLWNGRDIVVGLDGELAAIAAQASEVRMVAQSQTRLAPGDALAVILADDDRYLVRSPVRGYLAAINRLAVAEPSRLLGDLSDGGWIVRVQPRGWTWQDQSFAWGGLASVVRRAAETCWNKGQDGLALTRAAALGTLEPKPDWINAAAAPIYPERASEARWISAELQQALLSRPDVEGMLCDIGPVGLLMRDLGVRITLMPARAGIIVTGDPAPWQVCFSLSSRALIACWDATDTLGFLYRTESATGPRDRVVSAAQALASLLPTLRRDIGATGLREHQLTLPGIGWRRFLVTSTATQEG